MQKSLIDAVIREDVEQVEQLLHSGSNPNTFEDMDKITPLHFVAQKSSAEALQIARLLVKAKADPAAKSEPDGQTPLDIAKLMSSDEMVAILSGADPQIRLH